MGIRWRRWSAAALAISVTAVAHSFTNTETRIDQGRLFVPEPEHARLSSLGFDLEVYDYSWHLQLQDRELLEKEAEALGNLASECNRFLR